MPTPRASEYPAVELIREQGWNFSRRPSAPGYAKTYWDRRGGAVRKHIALPRDAEAKRLHAVLAHELMHAIGFDRGTIRLEPSRGILSLELEDMAEERIAETGAFILCIWFDWPYAEGLGMERFGLLKREDLAELQARLTVVASLAQGLGWPPVPEHWLSEDQTLALASLRAGSAQ